jgi:two-component system sensor histidine kinase KdpD
MRRALVGSLVGITLSVALGAALAPVRTHLSIATAALALVVPVVVGVVIGGFRAGVASVAAGFFVYDFAFIPPYDRLQVGYGQDLVALAVYAVVMVLVAKVVADLASARSEAQRRTAEAQRLFDLSQLLVENLSVEDLLKTIVGAVRSVFDLPGVALLVPEGDRLEIAASAGEALTREDLQGLAPLSGLPVSLATGRVGPERIRTVALTAAGRPIGVLATRGMPASEEDRALLRTFANHAALALERARLRDQALRSELLEEVDRLRHALVGAVSHDLRTPLATMKVASSTLLRAAPPLDPTDALELYQLIDLETDRLTRLVTSLLDMTRIDAGVLEVRRQPTSVLELIDETVAAVGATLGDRPVEVDVPDGLPDVDADQLLIGQVLANLLDNAHRYAPPDSLVTVSGAVRGDRIVLAVADRGPGVPPADRDAVFDRYVHFDTGGRAGLGLAIAKTFVEAHGEHIWVEDVPGGGARFAFSLAPTAPDADEPADGPASTGTVAVGAVAVGRLPFDAAPVSADRLGTGR